MIKKLFPQGKEKAFNVTYDDGVLQDVPFVNLLNKYKLKGTFNLNSELMEKEFTWIHESGNEVKRLSKDKVVDLYFNHEVASHTLTHPYMNDLSEEQILHELIQDKQNLEKLFNKKILGFAVPFDYYDERIAKCVKQCNFEYVRISEESNSFIPQEDYYFWKAGILHFNPNLNNFVDEFIKTNEELAICQIVGHSYDLDYENLWEVIENIFIKITNENNILPMTNIEIVQYLKAMRSTEILENKIINNSNIDLWFKIDNKTICVKANQNYTINK